MVTPTLGWSGAKSAPAYNALLNLAFGWWDPGVTRHPVAGGHWLQAQNPTRYPELSDGDVVAITLLEQCAIMKRSFGLRHRPSAVCT